MEFLAVAFFAVGATITPGPNNTLIMSSGLNFGVARSIPLLFGICLGFPALLFAFGSGLSLVMLYVPNVIDVLKVIGSMYLMYLAWKVFNLSTVGGIDDLKKPLSFFQGALYQWLNPKSWIMAASAITSFSIFSDVQLLNTIVISTVFIFVSIPCLGVWMVSGQIIRKYIKSERNLKYFNRSMALMLAVCVIQALTVSL